MAGGHAKCSQRWRHGRGARIILPVWLGISRGINKTW